nr:MULTISPECIES: transposase [Photorhabdus]
MTGVSECRQQRGNLKDNGYKSNEKARTDGRVKFDHETYRRRNVVERGFGRLKEYRRIGTRYEKTARNYIAMVKLGCIRLFLKTII